MANGALESFTKADAQELGPHKRINVFSPVFVKETMQTMGMDSTHGVSATDTAKAHLAAIEGNDNGRTLDNRDFV